jgi:hypothetical protein
MVPSKRMVSWTREGHLWKHLMGHVGTCRWPMQCPHPVCDHLVSTAEKFRFHLIDDHSIRLSRRDHEMVVDCALLVKGPASDLKRKLSEVDWVPSEEPGKRLETAKLSTAIATTISPSLLMPELTTLHLDDRSPSPAGTEDNALFDEFLRFPSPSSDYSYGGDTVTSMTHSAESRTDDQGAQSQNKPPFNVRPKITLHLGKRPGKTAPKTTRRQK